MSLRHIAAALVLTLPALAQAQPFEASFLAFATGTEETSRYNVNVATGDFDGDSLPDLAVARNVFAGGFTILRNVGDGTYGAPVHYGPVDDGGGPVPLPGNGLQGSYDLEAADFDEDGDVDIVATRAEAFYVGSTVALYRNAGDGTFAAPVATQVGEGGPFELDAADFDGDGHLDLAVTRYDVPGTGAAVSVLMGTGTGAFGAPTTRALFGERAEAFVEAGDLDGDGDVDLAVGTAGDARLAVFLNDGAGAFGAAALTAAPPAPATLARSLALADVDNDEDLDAVTAGGYDQNQSYGVLTVFRNEGAGAFTPVQVRLGGPNSFVFIPYDLVVEDFDGDGWVDVVGVDNSTYEGGLLVLHGDGAGGFLPVRRAPSVSNTVALTAVDYDADGDPDVVTVDRENYLVAVHPNRGGLELFTTPSFTVPYSTEVSLGDIDGDGDLDAVTTGDNLNAGSRTTVLRNDGAGAFQVTFTFGSGVLDAKLRDLNGDGRADVVAGFGGDLVYALSNGDGTMGATTQVEMASCFSRGMVDALDVDADGDLDLLLNEEFPCEQTSQEALVFVALNNGDATFAPAVSSFSEVPTGSANSFDQFTAGDLDEDGSLDLVFTDYTTMVVLGNGDGTFQTPVALPSPERQVYVVLEDLDDDGHLDLATAGGFGGFDGPSTAVVRRGTGTGAFSAPVVTEVGPGVSGIAAGDVDLDGDSDLLVSVSEGNGAAFLANDGAGAFTIPLYVGVAWDFSGGLFEDVTGDGLGDLVGVHGLPTGGLQSAFLVMVRGVDFRSTAGEPGAPAAPEAAAPPVALSAAAPNPATGTATFTLTVREGQRVVVEAFDALGRRVATLFDGPVEADAATRVAFDGAGLPGGVYFVRATGERVAMTQRVTLLR